MVSWNRISFYILCILNIYKYIFKDLLPNFWFKVQMNDHMNIVMSSVLYFNTYTVLLI